MPIVLKSAPRARALATGRPKRPRRGPVPVRLNLTHFHVMNTRGTVRPASPRPVWCAALVAGGSRRLHQAGRELQHTQDLADRGRKPATQEILALSSRRAL